MNFFKLAGLLAAFLCTPAFPFVTGGELKKMLDTPQGIETVKGYVYGSMDTFFAGQNAVTPIDGGYRRFKTYCIPDSVTKAEAFEVVVASIRTTWFTELPAPILVSTALSFKWPCDAATNSHQ